MVLCSGSFDIHYFSSKFIMTYLDINIKTKKTPLTIKTIFSQIKKNIFKIPFHFIIKLLYLLDLLCTFLSHPSLLFLLFICTIQLKHLSWFSFSNSSWSNCQTDDIGSYTAILSLLHDALHRRLHHMSQTSLEFNFLSSLEM